MLGRGCRYTSVGYMVILHVVHYDSAGCTYLNIGKHGTMRQTWGLGELELSKILSQFSETDLKVGK
jgi:hypothetical protein